MEELVHEETRPRLMINLATKTLVLFASLLLMMIGSGVAVAAEFVGVDVCAQCHQKELSAWQGSHHQLAMQEASEATVLGDFGDEEFIHHGITSRFFRKGNGFYVNTEGADGALADFEIKYTFGVEPLQQYLIEFDDGRLQALSIVWDTRPMEEGGQRWFHLYPTETIPHTDSLHWTGPNQNWNFMCAECHSTNLKRNYDATADTYATAWSEINVSCEACHGPASEHVAWAGSGTEKVANYGLQLDLSRDRAWIMNPNTGIAEKSTSAASPQVEICARCHSRRIVLSEEYQHGEPLMNTYRPQVLLEGLYHADGQILDEVYVYGSFIQSKMFDKGVVCTDCHDPHSLQTRAEGNALCGTCHLPERFDTVEHHFHLPGSEGAQCVNCHMPSRLYMVNDARRDHSFRVPRPDLAGYTGAPDVCTDCHLGRSPGWAAGIIRDKHGDPDPAVSHYGAAIQAGRMGALDAVPRLIELVDDETYPSIARATGAALLGGYLSPVSIQSLAVLLRDEDPLVRVNALSALEGADPRIKVQMIPGLLEDPVLAVRIEAAGLMADVPGELLSKEQQEAFGEVIDLYIKVQTDNADRAESWANLGNLYLRLGNALIAAEHYKHAIQLDPNFAPAYANLADMYRAQGRDEEAGKLLVSAIERIPRVASLHHAYGLFLVRRDELPGAIEELRKAAELDPANVRFRYVYAVALNSLGDTDAAIAELRLANEARPVDRDVLIALVNLYRQRGDLDEALRYAEDLARSAPWDRNAQAILNELSN